MKSNMERILKTDILIALVAVLITGCSAGNSVSQKNAIKVEAIKNSTVLFSQVRASKTKKGIVVSGQLQRLNSIFPLPTSGHLDIKTFDKNEKLISNETIPYQIYDRNRNRDHDRVHNRVMDYTKRYYFYTTLSESTEQTASVRIRYHSDSDTSH